ncbi:MAG TPA: hypothetical protein VIK05_14995, partial [Ilumatobacteraceae bacterium]
MKTTTSDIGAFPPPTPDDVPVAPTWTPPKTSSGVGRRILIVLGALVVSGAIRDFLTPSERSEVEDAWSALTAPERAMLCWGRDGAEKFGGTGLQGVPREVLDANCPGGEGQVITVDAPLGEETERKWLDVAKLETDDSPPTPQDLGLTEADLPALCALSAETVVRNLDPRFLEMA